MEGEVGPLVDGRPYKTAAARKAIEAYHKAALVAHKDHQTPTVEIPRF
jgi:cell division protease FtsH